MQKPYVVYKQDGRWVIESAEPSKDGAELARWFRPSKEKAVRSILYRNPGINKLYIIIDDCEGENDSQAHNKV